MKTPISALLLLLALPALALDAPELWKVEAIHGGAIELRWRADNPAELQAFEVERQINRNATNYVTLNPLKMRREWRSGEKFETFIWKDTNAIAGVLYTYRVRAIAESDESPPSVALDGYIVKGLKPRILTNAPSHPVGASK